MFDKEVVVLLVLLLLFLVSLLIFYCISSWKIFQKAGLPPWKSLIPIYHIYCYIVEIAGKSGILFIIWIALSVFGKFPISYFDLSHTEKNLLLYLYGLVFLTIYFLTCQGIARNFGKSRFFAFGLFILPGIFIPILAFGNSVFQKNTSMPKKNQFIYQKNGVSKKSSLFRKKTKDDYFDV